MFRCAEALAILVVVVAPASAQDVPAADERLDCRIRARGGTVLHYDLRVEDRCDPPPAARRDWPVDRRSHDWSAEVALRVDGVDGGAAELTLTFERMRGVVRRPVDVRFRYDSDGAPPQDDERRLVWWLRHTALAGRPLGISVDRRGRVTAVRGGDRLRRALVEDAPAPAREAARAVAAEPALSDAGLAGVVQGLVPQLPDGPVTGASRWDAPAPVVVHGNGLRRLEIATASFVALASDEAVFIESFGVLDGEERRGRAHARWRARVSRADGLPLDVRLEVVDDAPRSVVYEGAEPGGRRFVATFVRWDEQRLGEWVALLGSADAGDREEALAGFRSVGFRAAPAQADLVRLLKSGDARVAQAALAALAAVGGEALEACAGLGAVLSHRDAGVRVAAAETIAAIAGAARAERGSMVRRSGAVSRRQRARALEELEFRRRRASARTVPELVRALRDPDVRVRRAAALAIGAFGETARSATSELVAARTERNRAIESALLRALAAVRPTSADAVPALVRALATPDAGLRRSAALALVGLAPHAREALPALVRALEDPDPATRVHAVHALGAMGPLARPALPALRRAYQGEDAALNRAIADALAKIRGG